MPFLRVIRDKRGYETTYLMHWFREGNRQRSRILYVFRTPGGVRVGRDPFDPDVLRQIEASHPDITFEWRVIRDNQQIVEPAAEQRRRRPRGEDVTPPPVEDIAPQAPPAAASAAQVIAPERAKPVPSTLSGTTPDEQIAFLTEWYPQIVERIRTRINNPERQQTLVALAERLNPSAWTDADQITSGLQQASEALDRLSHVFARRRRRGRRRPAPTAAPGAAAPPEPPDAS